MSGQSAHQQNSTEEIQQTKQHIKGDNHNEKIKISGQFSPDILRVRL